MEATQLWGESKRAAEAREARELRELEKRQFWESQQGKELKEQLDAEQAIAEQAKAYKELMASLPVACNVYDSEETDQVEWQILPKLEKSVATLMMGFESPVGVLEMRSRFTTWSCLVEPPPTSTKEKLIFNKMLDTFGLVECVGSLELTSTQAKFVFNGEKITCVPAEQVIPSRSLYASPAEVCEHGCNVQQTSCQVSDEVPDAICQNNYYHCTNRCH